MTRSSIPLTDGGPLYQPSRPMGFHPALRAAAHLLVAGHRLGGGLLRDLRDRLLPLHPPTLRMLLSHHLRLTVDGFDWTGPRPRRGGLSITLLYLEHLWTWTRDRHLLSPWILEVLLLTVAAWHAAARDSATLGLASADPTPDDARTYPGPWIEALTAEPASADVAPLLRLTPEVRLVRSPEPKSQRFELQAPAWNPEIESFDDFKQRLQRTVVRQAQQHRRTVLEGARRRGCRPVGLRPTPQHLTWLARRQLDGWRPSAIARRYRAGVSTVHGALTSLSRLLDLPLRPVKAGRPGL